MILILGVSGMENTFPPFFILPRANLRGNFWNDAHAFSGGDGNPNGCMKEEYFLIFVKFTFAI